MLPAPYSRVTSSVPQSAENRNIVIQARTMSSVTDPADAAPDAINGSPTTA